MRSKVCLPVSRSGHRLACLSKEKQQLHTSILPEYQDYSRRFGSRWNHVGHNLARQRFLADVPP